MASDVSFFARTNHRNAGVPFGIKQADRLSHIYIIGKTGVGKSTLIENLVLQDLGAGRGFALIDPHGDLAERVYRILVEPQVDLRFRSMMDQGEVLLVNLSKGELGEDSSHLLGGLIVSTLGLAAFSRADMLEAARRPFALFIDEFQSFTTLMLANMAAELRKSAVSLVLAHQHLHQLESDIRHAVLGNTGTLISFRVGPEDAVVLAREFQPKFDVQDLLSLPNHRVYLKLMVDGTPSHPFSAEIPPPDWPRWAAN